MKLDNATILITGANRGISKAYAEAFLKAGAQKIYLGVRDLESVADMVAAHPKTYVALQLDVMKHDQIRKAAESAGDVNILVNNAGIAIMDDLYDADAAENARQQFETNFIGPLTLTQAFAPILKKNGGGIMITVSSIAGHVAFPGFFTYAASKFAAHAFILAARRDLAAQGTRVIGVYPGPIDTDMAKDIAMDKVSPAVVADETLKAIAGKAEDVFPDPVAQDLYAQHRQDPKALEQQLIQQAA